jgi:hypothetical protein
MILYHGSNTLIEKVELNRCKPFKDFGRGFYCTTIKAQAELMAKRVITIFGGTACVTQFELDESIFNYSSLRIKKFEGPSKEYFWRVQLQFDQNINRYPLCIFPIK